MRQHRRGPLNKAAFKLLQGDCLEVETRNKRKAEIESAEQKKKKHNPKKRNNPQLTDNGEISNTVGEEYEHNKPTGKKKKKIKKGNDIDVGKAVQIQIQENSPKVTSEKKRNKSKKKTRNEDNAAIEIMMLQSKFEQDRKRIQQLRAGRKFQPY